MVIRESAEMYLETILVLSKTQEVRAIDIAKAMNFSRPSVSVTLHNLEKEGYIKIQDNQNILLEEKGKSIAEKIYERHTFISSLLQNIGVSKEVATQDACKIEHDISSETFNCLKQKFSNI